MHFAAHDAWTTGATSCLWCSAELVFGPSASSTKVAASAVAGPRLRAWQQVPVRDFQNGCRMGAEWVLVAGCCVLLLAVGQLLQHPSSSAGANRLSAFLTASKLGFSITAEPQLRAWQESPVPALLCTALLAADCEDLADASWTVIRREHCRPEQAVGDIASA